MPGRYLIVSDILSGVWKCVILISVAMWVKHTTTHIDFLSRFAFRYQDGFFGM